MASHLLYDFLIHFTYVLHCQLLIRTRFLLSMRALARCTTACQTTSSRLLPKKTVMMPWTVPTGSTEMALKNRMYLPHDIASFAAASASGGKRVTTAVATTGAATIAERSG